MICTSRIDRRRCRRFNVGLAAMCRISGPADILYLIEGKEFEANVINISLGGAAIIVPVQLPENARLFMKMIVFETDFKGRANFYEVVKLFGNVRYCVEIARKRFKTGLYFTDMDEDRTLSLRNLLRSSLKKQPGSPFEQQTPKLSK